MPHPDNRDGGSFGGPLSCNLLLLRSSKEGIFPREECLSLPELLSELCIAADAADFRSGGWEKQVRGNEEKEKEAKRDKMTHRIGWIGRDFKDHLAPIPCF